MTKYPWKKWFARRRKFILRRGEHFDCTPKVMAQQFRTRSVIENKKVSIQIVQDTLVVEIRDA